MGWRWSVADPLPTPTPPTPEPDAEAKLAAVERLLLEWADAPGGGMGDLLDLVEAVRRVVAS
jgi:hypothetical protein